MLSRNKIKYLSALKNKKSRHACGQFLVEGDKMVIDLLRYRQSKIRHLVATSSWLLKNSIDLSPLVEEISEADPRDIQRISSFETPPEVVALVDFSDETLIASDIVSSLSIVLDTIQDPGNLGTIIRTADWFDIRNIVCSESCADCYNPKVVQASMGALFNVKVHYVNLGEWLVSLPIGENFPVLGTFLQGEPIACLDPVHSGLMLFGNESRGVSAELQRFVTRRITIPSVAGERIHVESLNVASAVAIVCSVLRG